MKISVRFERNLRLHHFQNRRKYELLANTSSTSYFNVDLLKILIFLEKIKPVSTRTRLSRAHFRRPGIHRDLSLAVYWPPNWVPWKWESEFTVTLTVCSPTHRPHMLVEQRLHYIAINEQLMTYSDRVPLNRLCRLTLKPKQTKMNMNTAKEKGMKMQVLDADRE